MLNKIESPVKILTIQARRDPRAEQAIIREIVGEKAHVTFANTLALGEDIQWATPEDTVRKYDGFLFLGSSDVRAGPRDEKNKDYKISTLNERRAGPLARTIVEGDIPAMGICLGHQMLHQAGGGDVQRDVARREAGTTVVKLTEAGKQHPLLPNEDFGLVYAHIDFVTKPAAGADILGETKRDPHSLTQIGENILTLQGHPEINEISILQGVRPEEDPDYSMIQNPHPRIEQIIVKFLERATQLR